MELKMDIDTLKYIVDKAKNDLSAFPVEYEECENCGAVYVKGIGHKCGNVVEVPVHETEVEGNDSY